MCEVPDRPDEEQYQDREQRDEPTHEEREEWIRERDETIIEAARRALHEKMVADELTNIVLPDIALTRHQAE